MYKVIIADDKPLIRAGLFYRNNWEEMGYNVISLLEDGSDVLELLQNERADVLLADICMYSVSGLEVAKVIQEKYPWMKVVLISGYQDFQFAKEAIQYKVYDYLLKPIDYEKLRDVFAKIKKELDAEKWEKLLKDYFHEKEYEQLLNILRHIPETGEEEENSWGKYVPLGNVLSKKFANANSYVAREMFQALETEIKQLDQNIWNEFNERLLQSNYEDGCISLLLEWLKNELEDKGFLLKADQQDEEILEACRYITEHLSENLSLEKVAGHIHLSTRQFTRRFIRQTGEKYKDYLYRVRMEMAVSLIEQGKMSLEDICVRVGYEDYKYFRQLLKNYTGNSSLKL